MENKTRGREKREIFTFIIRIAILESQYWDQGILLRGELYFTLNSHLNGIELKSDFQFMMDGFTVRTQQNGLGSPKSIDSPTSVGLPVCIESPLATNSPKIAAEIDTRAPFQSVKAALSLFKDEFSPKSQPLAKRSNAEERVLEKETQHNMIIRELEYYKDQLKSAETEKTRALQDLEKGNRTLQQLTNKIETLTESKQYAIRDTEVAKIRTKELEEQKSVISQLGSEAWKLEVNNERERYNASSQELNVRKQEIITLRQNFDATLAMKLASFQEAENARHVATANQERRSQLSKEVANMHESLNQVKLAQLEAQEKHSKVIEEKEALLLNYRSAKEKDEKEINRLKDKYEPAENLQEKLEETNEAIKVLREQLDSVHASDLHSLQSIVSELEISKQALQEFFAEKNLIQNSVDSLKLQLKEIQRKRSEAETKALVVESIAEQMQVDLEKKLSAEAEKARYEAEEINNNIEILKQEAETARIAAQESEKRLLIALNQVEAAKGSKKLADDQVNNSPKTKAGGELRKIGLSIEEFESMNKKIEKFESEADFKLAIAMAQIETIKASEKEVLDKVDAVLKWNGDIESEIVDALKRAEMAEAARRVVEVELQKWRKKQQKEVVNIS